MVTKMLVAILVFIFVAALWLLAGEAYAERAIWVWGMAKDIVLNSTAKTDFFNFCAAPKGDATKAITLVFFDAKPWGYNLMTSNPVELRQFLTDAHSRGIKVEFLSGDKAWATPGSRAIGENLIDEVTNFNLGGTSAEERFDGIHYDVEPYLLKAKEKGDPYDWEYDKALVWSEYLTLLTNCQTRVNAYNTANNPDIRFGVAIPYWYGQNSVDNPQAVIDIVDYVAVMAYKDTSANIINAAQDEIQYAASVGKKVYVGVETSHPKDTMDFPPGSTFYEEGNDAMETVLSEINTTFLSYSSYAGIAIHYYEDLIGARGKEISYRSLWTDSNPYKGRYPVVNVLSPNKAGEVWVGAMYIQWTAIDLDGDSITIDIKYSTDDGVNWANIATGIVQGSSNKGSYMWYTDYVPVGSNYLIKVLARDGSTNQLIGYDVSDNKFSVSRTLMPTDITDLHLWNESTTSLRLKWTPPTYTPSSYAIYRSNNGMPFVPIAFAAVLVDDYIDTGLSSAVKYKYYIMPRYGNTTLGNASNISNMLIPSDTFLIDYAEENEGLASDGPWGAGLTYSFDTNIVNVKEGLKSLKLNYTYSGGWGGILIRKYANTWTPPKVDISPYAAVQFWAKGTAGGTHTIRLQLRENGGYLGDEAWQSPVISIGSDWNLHTIIISDFTRESVLSGTGDNRLDTHTLGAYALAFYGGAGGPYTYYIDEIKLIKAAASIDVPLTSYSFGTLLPTVNDHRFRIGPIPVTYSGYSPPWTIRIWTNNGGTAGLKGVDGVTYMPLKVWCANYGPTASVPDEEDDAYWVANSTGWFRIPEKSEMNPSNVYTWRRLSWISGGQDASLSNPFDIYLAVDANGMPAQDYTTTTLTVEYINE